ncbi:hypothetical protein [Clostridium botulinum]|uniref:hypothetical protein n=1 Tax=Clostridium botulinum TaxID=1491 RepID=UPI0004D5D15C|nr:hypothetical protein [Clostridium botulinum]KEI05440.1 hypothetical protein Z952_05195 [Clostridium botulinum C/D str. BKT75002]KEI09391.1 hypothetical protein Z954_12725 [Clostridium botulinum C/D str. BKT2873]MCD3349411.1 hypothetical protein [Clostridium botulinum D/C]MCD3358598.1 hypothetical protein [Clostridium botulinum D/C]MCD3363671.1 hypothetical protein [Clostridium botulinum D/C]
MNISDSVNKRILHVCNCEYDYFLRKPYVVGVGLGYKIARGINTLQKCIKVFVEKKVTIDELNEGQLIPLIYKGLLTDVVETGCITSSSLTQRIRPVLCGYNISPVSKEFGGTMGCVVTDGKFYYILSNNHVIALNGKYPIETPIIQPSGKFHGKAPEDTIAELSKYIPMKPSKRSEIFENFVDCAIGKVTRRSQISTKLAFVGRIKGVVFPKIGKKVQIVGAFSERRYGQINALGVSTNIQFDGKKYLFKNQIFTTKMAQPGDSGSILLDDNINAVGMLMSGSKSLDVFNSITTVLSSLNVRIVTG